MRSLARSRVGENNIVFGGSRRSHKLPAFIAAYVDYFKRKRLYTMRKENTQTAPVRNELAGVEAFLVYKIRFV